MFGGHKKLYAEGAQTEGVVVRVGESKTPGYYWYTVRVRFPDGSTTEFEAPSDGFAFDEGQVVPVRYDPSNHKKVVLDVPVLKEKSKQVEAAQQAQYDAQLAHLGEPGSATQGDVAAQLLAGLGGGGDLKAQLLAAVESGGSVIDLRSASRDGSATDPVDRLAKLAALKQQGLLSDEQFEAAKAKVLGES
jgi:Short C-terminal domain